MIPLSDPSRFARLHLDELRSSFDSFITSGQYILGNAVAEFEKEFADFTSTDYCISVANGTDALQLSLIAIDVAGKEVIVAPNAGGYSTIATLAAGGIPIYVDIDPSTLLMDQDLVIDAIGPNTRAVIITHLYGLLFDVQQLQTKMDQVIGRRIPIVEDCAQAHGARIGARKAGKLGVTGCFSFYPTKNLGALGDGGAVVTTEPEIANRILSLRQYGWGAKYNQVLPGGMNSRLDEVQAGFLSILLRSLEESNFKRRRIIQRYALAGAPLVHKDFADDERFVAHLAVCRFENREDVIKRFNEFGISTGIHYPIVDPDFPVLRGKSGLTQDLKHAYSASNEVLSLPCFPELTDVELDLICDAIGKI